MQGSKSNTIIVVFWVNRLETLRTPEVYRTLSSFYYQWQVDTNSLKYAWKKIGWYKSKISKNLTFFNITLHNLNKKPHKMFRFLYAKKKQIVLKLECLRKRKEGSEIITALCFLWNENIPLSLIHSFSHTHKPTLQEDYKYFC